MITGRYIGVRRRLNNKTALLQEVPGGFRAQFDDRTVPEAFGWTFFPAGDFSDVRYSWTWEFKGAG